MITIRQLLPGVTLRCFRDPRFKQGCLSLSFLRPMDHAEAAMNALIPNVLLRGTVRHPDLRSITMALDDLYGASVSPMVRRIGDCHAIGLYAGFMDQRFALPGDRVLEPMVQFLRELLLEYPTEDGGFCREFVESEKKNLISTIESNLNDKHAYATQRLVRSMCREDSFGVPRLGRIEEVAAIEPDTLLRHYRRLLKESPVNLFYVGSADEQTVADLLLGLFEGMERDPLPLPPQTGFHNCPGTHEREAMEVTQGKLCMGFTTPITNRTPEFAAMQVLNTVLGGGMTSKLFVNVREKLSLCYSISSGYYGTKGILLVSAGIDFDKEDTVRQEIAHQLQLCCEGSITEAELTSAKEAMLSSLRSTHDSPGSIEGYYSSSAVSGARLTPQEYMDAIEAVTVQQAAAAAATLVLHSTFFLHGEDRERTLS